MIVSELCTMLKKLIILSKRLLFRKNVLSLHRDKKSSTSYHNKAVMAEGLDPILPLRWEFFVI